MTVLRSYVSGAWIAPADDGRPVLDAVTGQEVARVSSAGIDLGAALAYGRSAGGPALRELTFHQRAALLKSLGMLLREHRQEMLAATGLEVEHLHPDKSGAGLARRDHDLFEQLGPFGQFDE
jgi:acyl-CoA reductase-like NAD-dependent aldehyde dehydrogenase